MEKKTKNPEKQLNRPSSKKPGESDLLRKTKSRLLTDQQSQQAIAGEKKCRECAEQSERAHRRTVSGIETTSSPEPNTFPAGSQAGRLIRQKTTAATSSGFIFESSLSGCVPLISNKRTRCGEARYAVVIPKPELNGSFLRVKMTMRLDAVIE